MKNHEAQEEEEHPYARDRRVDGDEYEYEDRQGPRSYDAYNEDDQAGGPVAG